jgi:dihydroflavonol-4-reductase
VPGGPPVSPELPVAPATTAYARSKAQAEFYVRQLQARDAPVRISYPAGIVGPDDPGMSDANHAVYTWFVDAGVVTSSGFQCVDVRDVAALHVKLLELPEGAHAYAAAAEMLPWADVYDLLDRLTGARLRRLVVPGWLMRAAGSVGDVVKRVYDFNFPLTRDSMEFATRWPGADATRTTRELGLVFRPIEETYRDTLRWMHRAGHLTAAQVGKLAGSSSACPARTCAWCCCAHACRSTTPWRPRSTAAAAPCAAPAPCASKARRRRRPPPSSAASPSSRTAPTPVCASPAR